MRIAALYDIHGNLPALEAALAEIKQVGVDRIVIGGDVMPGPMAREAIEVLLTHDVPLHFIHGNGETAVLAEMAGGKSNVPEAFRSVIQWHARNLEDYEYLLSDWPLTQSLEVDGVGRVVFCHATPRDDNEIFTRLTPEESLLPIFDAVDADVVVCGHTHMQFDRQIGRTRVVNAGSVGMPFGLPGAHWLLIGPDIEQRRTDYDLVDAARRLRQSDYPQADEFVLRYLLDRPTEEQMLQAFSKVPLK